MAEPRTVMTGLDPAIRRGRVPVGMAGTVAGHDVKRAVGLVPIAVVGPPSVKAALDPAIRRGRVPVGMAGTMARNDGEERPVPWVEAPSHDVKVWPAPWTTVESRPQ